MRPKTRSRQVVAGLQTYLKIYCLLLEITNQIYLVCALYYLILVS